MIWLKCNLTLSWRRPLSYRNQSIGLLRRCIIVEHNKCSDVANCDVADCAVTWRTVHEHIVADPFGSKKRSSALLVHAQQASQKTCLLNRHSTASVCVHICIHFFNHKQLNGDSEGIYFVMLAVLKQVALMSPSKSEMRLLLYVNQQFAMSLHLFCSTILHLFLILSANNSAIER